MKRNKRTRQLNFSTGTIFVSEEEMRAGIGAIANYNFVTKHHIRLQTLMELRKKMIRAKLHGKLGNGIIYFTYGKSHDHAHLHFFANDFKSAKSFFEVLKTLDKYMY